MKSFIYNLEKEIEKKLKKIESADLNILKKSLEASLILGDAFQKMKEFISTYTFRNEAEEIEFFKVIKPRMFYHLIYYRKIYNIEMNRPVGVESQRAYHENYSGTKNKTPDTGNITRATAPKIAIPESPLFFHENFANQLSYYHILLLTVVSQYVKA